MIKGNPPDKANNKTDSAQVAGTSTFLLDQKVDKKSLPAALNDPLMNHYRRDLMIDSFGSKSLLLSLIKWVPHLRY